LTSPLNTLNIRGAFQMRGGSAALKEAIVRTSTFFVFLSLAISGVSAEVHAQAAGPASAPKQYPWDMRPKKCFMPGAMEMAPSLCAAKDWTSYAETTGRVQRLLIDADFDLVERAENELGFSRDQFPSGQYRFDAWYLALDTLFTNPWEQSYARASAWAKAKGEDGYVKLAEALLRYGEAWKARGSGYGNTVTPEGWDIYRRKIREADQVLDSASDRLKRMGPWHVLKLKIAYQLPELENGRASLLEAASDAWPDYSSIYTTAMVFSLPKWGGTYQQVEKIARLAVEKSKNRLGVSLYPIVYQQMFRYQCDCVLPDTAVDWSLMKRGFRDIETRGRADGAAWKVYANLACQMRDRGEARRLLELSDKLRGPHGAEPPDPCREFAFSPT